VPIADDDRVDEVLVQVVNVRDDPTVERARHRHVVECRQVLDELAQAHRARVGTHGHAEAGREEQDRDDLVDPTEPARVDLADPDGLCLEQLFDMTRLWTCSPVATRTGETARAIVACPGCRPGSWPLDLLLLTSPLVSSILNSWR
jgi:hypothetical protein